MGAAALLQTEQRAHGTRYRVRVSVYRHPTHRSLHAGYTGSIIRKQLLHTPCTTSLQRPMFITENCAKPGAPTKRRGSHEWGNTAQYP